VFEIIQLFAKYNGNFSWPARKSENETPFSMLLEKLAEVEKKPICLKIIRFLINKYPKIDMFQKEKCAKIIENYFGELSSEYEDKIVKNREEETEETQHHHHHHHELMLLQKLIVDNETEFLVKFKFVREHKEKELEEYLKDDAGHHQPNSHESHTHGEKLILLAIKHDRFESFVDIYETYKIDINKVAENALSFNRIRVLKYILKLDCVCNPKWMIFILQKMKDKELDINPSTLRCFHFLLNHKKYKLNKRIPELDNITALHFAATRSEYAVIELLKKGASLGTRNNKGKMAIQFIDSSALSKFLDSCITKCSSDANSNIDYYMVIDYSFLKASEEMPPIHYMTEAKDVQPLIKHPVIASVLFLKWFRLSIFFYLNLLLTTFNALTFIAYLMKFYVHHDHLDSSNHTLYEIMYFLAIVSFIILSAKEVSQFISSPKSYLSSLVNFFEIFFLGLMAIALFLPLGNQQYHRSIAALLYLGFAIEWTMMLSELPIFSVCNYLVMLKKVAINFIRTLAFYSTILLAFAGSFYTLTNITEKNNGNFTTDGLNTTMEADDSKEFSMFSVIFHVFLMLTGDFDQITGKVEDFTIGRLFLLVFVLSMSIVMMNLLIGLTVSDTAAIEAEAEWYKWYMRAKLLGKYEDMASSW
jgi:hypothetical protein